MKRNTLEHPKVLELADALDLPRYAVIGILESLWVWTGRYCSSGDVGRYSNRRLATEAIRWDGDPDALIAALVETRWLDEDPDYRLLIHDWADHADDATRTALEKAGAKFATGESPRKYRLRTNATESRLKRPDTPLTTRDSIASETRQSGSGSGSEPESEPEPGYTSPEPAADAASRAGRSGTRTRPKPKSPEVAFPEPFPRETREKLYAWGAPQGFDAGQVDFALEAIAIKSRARGYRNRDWYAACQGYIRSGWPLQGYQDGVGGSALQNVMLAIEGSRSLEREQLASRSGQEAPSGGKLVSGLHGDKAGPSDT